MRPYLFMDKTWVDLDHVLMIGPQPEEEPYPFRVGFPVYFMFLNEPVWMLAERYKMAKLHTSWESRDQGGWSSYEAAKAVFEGHRQVLIEAWKNK